MTAPLPLCFQEQVTYTLRSLYDRYGYTRYKMSKFEEYDLYARNKDFLISDRVITFMDTSGCLLALKPDVTLSIVKNSRDNGDPVQKLYYNENVYRVSKNAGTFRELMQVGLECLGKIDDYCICEVLALAAESLEAISPDWVLDISHLGLLSNLIDAVGIPTDRKHEVLTAIGGKNRHELAALCGICGVSDTNAAILTQAISLSGPVDTVLLQLRSLLSGIVDLTPLDQLLRITGVLSNRANLRFDFSVVGDIHYYNGIVFKGFLKGLPGSVLSGGQYDRLMEKMGRTSGAIGFAVYMDALDRLDTQRRDYDADTVLLYDDSTPLEVIRAQVRRLNGAGQSVLVQRNLPENIRCRQIIRL